MKIFGVAGLSGSGKTTLLTSLIPLLVRTGITVSTVKHAHHAFDVDQPGKDSYQHREAGATEVMISSAARWALMHEHRGAPEPMPKRESSAPLRISPSISSACRPMRCASSHRARCRKHRAEKFAVRPRARHSNRAHPAQ